MLRYIAIVLFLVPTALSHAAEDDALRPPPWHLVDIWWDTGKDWPFESYAIDVTISDEVPDGINLYVAPIGLGHLNKTPFYGGIQTQADGYTKQDHRLRKIGPGLLMSMWGERTLDAIRPSAGGFCQSSGHEGDFVSVRRAYVWKKGKFTYRIVRMDKELVEGKPCTWVGAFVYSHENDENIFVGALRFPGEDLVLAQRIASFVEIYGRSIPVEKIPKLRITFGDLRVNGQAIESPAATAIYPEGVPDYADATAIDGHVVVSTGQQVVNREKRQTRLLPEKD
ncbi:MAG: hypothetical protein RIC55_19110 [Pirellulaceae bacterium]